MLDIIVVSYKVPYLLHECIKSIAQHTHISYKLIVVDNASNDGTVTLIKSLGERIPQLQAILLEENISYGPGANVGIGEGTAKYVAVLNNDIIVPPGYDALTKYLDKNPDVGIIGPKLVNYENKIVGAGVTNNQGYHTTQGMLHPNSDRILNEVMDVIYVGGAALFMRREMLEQLREKDGFYFDPQFDFYFEEFDLTIRAKQLGWRVQYCPLATLIHKHEGTIEVCPPRGHGGRIWRNEKHATNLAKFNEKWKDVVSLDINGRMIWKGEFRGY